MLLCPNSPIQRTIELGQSLINPLVLFPPAHSTATSTSCDCKVSDLSMKVQESLDLEAPEVHGCLDVEVEASGVQGCLDVEVETPA